MHLEEGTIHAWLDGALDAEEAARIDRHAAECAACAAAVAEARGLVAGASRILTALDSVPGGIVPKAASPATTRARRTRSLWTSLHLTPARAAAAAVVVIAAGTALVLRSAPNAARSAVTLADYAHDSAVTLKAAAPLVLPLAVPDTAASRTAATPKREGRPSRTVATNAAPRPSGASARRGVVGEGAMERSAAVAAAEEAKQPVVATDNAVRGAVAGAASRAPAAAPPSAVAQRFDAAKVLPDSRSAAGCYLVTTDSAISLPTRLWLDSAIVAQPAMLQRSKAAAADAGTMERHGVSEVVNVGRRSISGAFWSPRADGSIRVSLPANLVELDLRPVSASMLAGTAAIGGRSTSVTLRRAECGSR
jgi:hypothetical protein